MMRLRIALLLSIVALPACGEESTADKSTPTRDRSAKKDRGEAAMTLGTATWQASSAKAKLSDAGVLTIRASRTQMTDGKVQRQELHLQLADYTGPGDYKTGFQGSRFIGVGIDVDAAKEDASDEEAAKAATDALSKAKHLMLSNAPVQITTATGTEIRGTFSWQPPRGIDLPAIENGTFRALVDD